jgi:hypothetical protein
MYRVFYHLLDEDHCVTKTMNAQLYKRGKYKGEVFSSLFLITNFFEEKVKKISKSW